MHNTLIAHGAVCCGTLHDFTYYTIINVRVKSKLLRYTSHNRHVYCTLVHVDHSLVHAHHKYIMSSLSTDSSDLQVFVQMYVVHV